MNPRSRSRVEGTVATRSPRRLALVGLALALALIVACAPASRVERDSAVLLLKGRVTTINELLSQGTEIEDDVIRQVYSSLVREQPNFHEGPPTFAPELAESWTFSEDRLELTFQLRENALWSDGSPVTSADVVFTWEAQTTSEIGWPYADAKQDIVSVEAIAARTVRFRFSEPSAAQLGAANLGVILPRHAWSQLPFAEWRSRPDWFWENPVTSGPFRLHRWLPEQDTIELEGFDGYFRPGMPRLRRVVLRFTNGSSSLHTSLIAGDADFVNNVAPRQSASARDVEGVRFIDYPTRQYNYVVWNTQRPLFSDQRVRRAMALAVDRQQLVDTLWFGRAKVATTPVLSSLWAYDPSLSPLPYDPDGARALLREAGWQDHDGDGLLDRDGEVLGFELLTNSGSEIRWDAVELIVEQLAQVGVEVRASRLELNAALEHLLEHDFEAALFAFGIDTSLTFAPFHSRSIDQGHNFGGYANPRVDELLDEIAAADDLLLVEGALHEFQQILHREQPMMFLWEPVRTVGVAAGLENVEPNQLGAIYNLHEWRWAEQDS